MDKLKPEEFLKDNLVIEGGHYVIQDGKEAIGDIEIYTWREAVRLYVQAIKSGFKKVGLVLMVDDFGVDPKLRQSFHANYRLSKPYLAILDEYDLKGKSISVAWSTQLRNRADKDLRKSRVKNVEKSENGYVIKFKEGGAGN